MNYRATLVFTISAKDAQTALENAESLLAEIVDSLGISEEAVRVDEVIEAPP